MDGLHQKLENQGLKDVVYMVVNQQEEQAQRLHPMLAQKLSENITLYKQDEQQPDIWQALGGEKDDFLIYDRCGRLTYHISLPYSIIGQGHIEGAIKDTYCKRVCGDCTHESTETPEECTRTPDAQPDADAAPAVEDGHGHHHGHHHGHGHHHHGHGHHGVDHGIHPRGHDHNHGQQGVSQQGQEQVGGDHLDLGQMQQVVHMHQMPQDAQGAPVRP
ncbi:hypothetical protein ABVT39_012939 [Epinephelus coioides]